MQGKILCLDFRGHIFKIEALLFLSIIQENKKLRVAVLSLFFTWYLAKEINEEIELKFVEYLDFLWVDIEN